MFVKICGITTVQDAMAAVRAGADAIGLNFVPTSPRFITADMARSILAAVPSSLMTVGVFRDRPAAEVIDATRSLGLNAAQLHGDESPAVTAEVASMVRTVIKAVRADAESLRTCGKHGADIILVDAAEPGSGRTFDWTLVGDLVSGHRILLAGGLRPANVAQAIAAVRPWGVDAASGIESQPGQKDEELMLRFVRAAQAAAENLSR